MEEMKKKVVGEKTIKMYVKWTRMGINPFTGRATFLKFYLPTKVFKKFIWCINVYKYT